MPGFTARSGERPLRVVAEPGFVNPAAGKGYLKRPDAMFPPGLFADNEGTRPVAGRNDTFLAHEEAFLFGALGQNLNAGTATE